MRYGYGLFLLMVITAASAQTKENGSSIVVRLNGITTPAGQVLLSLFNASEGFPTHPEKAFRWATAAVTSSSLIISMDGLPPGTYAIAVVQDENMNGVMDTNWMGLPDEPYGISNNIINTVLPPTFEESNFIVSGKQDTIRIEMHP